MCSAATRLPLSEGRPRAVRGSDMNDAPDMPPPRLGRPRAVRGSPPMMLLARDVSTPLRMDPVGLLSRRAVRAAPSGRPRGVAASEARRKGSVTPRWSAGLRLAMPERSFGRSTLVGPPRP